MLAHQTCIVVLGMHRSGTSALTGVLSLLGIHPGNRLLPPMEDINPKGFWEHAEIVSIHNELLGAFNSSWEDESPLPDQWWHSPLIADMRSRIINVLCCDFRNQPIWLIKDPRMCRLLPLWWEIFRELACQPKFILALRNPAEVAHSLHKRDDLDEEASCLLWLTHMLEAEYQTRNQPRAFVSYERLLYDWRGTVAEICRTLCITWPVSTEDAAQNIEIFLDSSLRHHTGDISLPDHPACQMAQKGFKLLSASSLNEIEIDQLRIQTEGVAKFIAPLLKRLRQGKRYICTLKNRNSSLNSESAMLRAEIKRIKSTFSWRITKPLRAIWNGLRRLFPAQR